MNPSSTLLTSAEDVGPSDIGQWVQCKFPGGRRVVPRLITRITPSGTVYARATLTGPERPQPQGIQIVARHGAAPPEVAFASPGASPATSSPVLAGALAGAGSRAPAQSSSSSTSTSSHMLYRIPQVPGALPTPVGATSVRTLAPDTPFNFLARTVAAHVDGNTPLRREYSSEPHGITVVLQQDPLGHNPRTLTIHDVSMPQDAWAQGLFQRLWDTVILPKAKIAGFDIIELRTAHSEELGNFALADWKRRVTEAQRRPSDVPVPDWSPLSEIAVSGEYVVVRRGTKTGQVAVWLQEKKEKHERDRVIVPITGGTRLPVQWTNPLHISGGGGGGLNERLPVHWSAPHLEGAW